MSYEPRFIWGVFSKEHKRRISSSAWLSWAQWPGPATPGGHVAHSSSWGHRGWPWGLLGCQAVPGWAFFPGHVFPWWMQVWRWGPEPPCCPVVKCPIRLSVKGAGTGRVSSHFAMVIPLRGDAWGFFCLRVGLQHIEEGPYKRRGGRPELCGEEVSPLEFQFSAVRLQLQCEGLHPWANAGDGDVSARLCAGAS